MNSMMVRCFDYTTLEVPDRLRIWIDQDYEKEIENELKNLSADHSREVTVDGAVQEGDSVKCVCWNSEDEFWGGRSVLLFPGRNLSGAKDAEECVIGKSAGEIFSCFINEKKLTLKIEQVVRRSVIPVGNELIELLQIPDVHSVEEYYIWYHKKYDPEKKKRACIKIAQFWLENILDKSEFIIDEKEKSIWCRTRAELMYKGMLAAGVDCTVQEDGSVISTDAAIEKIAKEQEIRFAPYLIYEYFCKNDNFFIGEEQYLTQLARIAEEKGLSMEETLEQSDIQLYREVYYQEHTFDILCRQAEPLLEDEKLWQ